MIRLDEITTDKMGRLYNKLIRMIDKSKLTVPETVLILRLLTFTIEQQFLQTIVREK